MSPSFATALLVTAVCAAIALLLILLVTRTVRANKARLKAVAADLARAEQRVRDEVNGRYPKPSRSNTARLTVTRDAILKAGASFPEKTSLTEAVAQAKRAPIVPLNTVPNPSLNRVPARNRGTRPTRNVGYQPYRPAMLTPDAWSSDRDRERRESEARTDALSSAVLAATAMDAIISAPSYSAPEPSYSAPDTSSWSSPSSSYDGGSSSSFDSGSFGGGDSGSF